MSKQRNKRNTRRGRAKRWVRRRSTSGRSQFRLRGTKVVVLSAPIFRGEWGTFDMGTSTLPAKYRVLYGVRPLAEDLA